MSLLRTGLIVIVVTGLGLTAAACGSGSADSTGTSSSSSTRPVSTPAATADAGTPTGNVPGDPRAATFEKPAAGSGKGVKIGYISEGDSIPFVKLVSDDIKAEAKLAGANLVFCDSQLDAAKALDCAKNVKTQGVDVIINEQLDAKSAPRICAAGPDVPTIAVDVNQKPCQVSFMGANNERAGEIAGDAMGQYFKSKFNCDYDAVVSMQVSAAGIVNTQRSEGALKGFETICGKAKNLKIVDGDGTLQGGHTKFADVLTSLPGQHKIIVLSLNDDMALGALAAARSQGRVEDLYLAGQGADPTSHCQILNNTQWVGDAAYFPEKYGQIAVPAAIKAAKGEQLPTTLFVPHVLINKDNITQYYDMGKC